MAAGRDQAHANFRCGCEAKGATTKRSDPSLDIRRDRPDAVIDAVRGRLDGPVDSRLE